MTPDMLVRAYALGIFPMAKQRNDPELVWVDPEWRGILPLDGFHLPRSLRKVVKTNRFRVDCDLSFAEVIDLCGAPTPERPETWINAEIRRLFIDLFEVGMAHSVECRLDGRLVGGLYGLSLGAAFFGESMFSRVTDASKVALVHLVARLIRGGYRLLDTQFVTPHLAQFGAIEIPRRDYLCRLSEALDRQGRFYGDFGSESLEGGAVLAALSAQSTTHRS